MDPRSATHLLLLILGLAIFAVAQQDPIQCVKEDEPLKGEQSCPNNWICPSNVICDNQATCRCENGYFKCKKKGLRYCRDINECKDNRTCGSGATCKNTIGSYYCECDKKLQRNSSQFCPMKNITNYCEDGEDSCPNNWICPRHVNCSNHAVCRCKAGYYQCEKKGVRFCRDVKHLMCPVGTLPPNSTNYKNRICPVNQTCNASHPCIPGYQEVKNECVDIPECVNGSHNCGSYAGCKNTLGGYYCRCNKGFQKVNQTEFCPSKDIKENECKDINECSYTPGVCVSNFICRNTLGSYQCLCKEGFSNVSNTCVDNRVKDKCSSLLEEKEKCDRMNPPDAACSALQTTFTILNSSCHSYGNKTIEDAKEQLQNATNNLSKKLDVINLINNQPSENSSTNDNREVDKFVTNTLSSVETIMLTSFIDAPRNQTIITPQLTVTMKASRDVCTPGVESFTLILNSNIMAVPCTHRDKDGAIFIVYKDLESSLNKNNILSSQVSQDDDDRPVVISKVVTGSITHNLTSHVAFTLALIQALKPRHNMDCVFWDLKKNDWSKDGCWIEFSKSNDTHTTCTCNHLSSFAVIMAPVGLKHSHALTVISDIGLSLSVFCLVLSLLTFILCRSLRSAHTSVLTAMCSCLFLGQLLFLVGLQRKFYKVLCSLIAGGLHFLFLCAFCWMSIESVLLFMTVRNLRAVNYMTSRRSNFPTMCLLGFGVPAVIVGISAAIQPYGYGTENYCWLEYHSAIWSFLGPVAVLIITNTTLLVFTIKLLRNRLATLNTNVSTLKNTRLLTFKASAQLLILGCTWGIGFFQFGEGSLVISYIFTICNSLQGVYIFLVHCVFNNQVKQEYRKLFCRVRRHSKQSLEDSTPNTGTKTINLTEISKPATSESASASENIVNFTRKEEPM